MTAGSTDMLKEWAAGLAPARAALKVGDAQRGIPLFVDGVGGPGEMNLDNLASYQADATTTRPRPVFTCEMAKAITAPTLLSNGERSPRLFHRVIEQLEICLPNSERIEIAASSHTVPSDNPNAYDQAVLAFIAKH
jgi:non-heme chloroperoxidase